MDNTLAAMLFCAFIYAWSQVVISRRRKKDV